MSQLDFNAYEVYQGNLLIDYWCCKENEQYYPKIQFKKINKKMSKLKIDGCKNQQKEKDEMLELIAALGI